MSEWHTIKTLVDYINSQHYYSEFFPNGTYESFEDLRPLLLKALEQRGVDGARADGLVGMAWLTVYEILDSHRDPQHKKNVKVVLQSVVEWLEILLVKIEGVSLTSLQEISNPLEASLETTDPLPHSTTPAAPESRGHEPQFNERTWKYYCRRCGLMEDSWAHPCINYN